MYMSIYGRQVSKETVRDGKGCLLPRIEDTGVKVD